MIVCKQNSPIEILVKDSVIPAIAGPIDLTTKGGPVTVVVGVVIFFCIVYFRIFKFF